MIAKTLGLQASGLDCRDTMIPKRNVLVAALMVSAFAMSAFAVAGCSSSATGGTSTTTSSPARSTTSTTGASSTNGTPSTSTAGSHAVNVAVTNQIREQLVAAGAALNGIPVSEYTGLAPGLTYYGFDRTTATYWAAARLVPAPAADPSKPTQAQISSQDAGSYYLFEQPQGGTWTAYADGNVGPDTPCPVTVPADVVAVWGWPTGACRPTNT